MNGQNRLPLSDRQFTIAIQLRNGLSQPEIAAFLGISYNSVKTHVRRIYENLGINNLADLIAILNKFLGDRGI